MTLSDLAVLSYQYLATPGVFWTLCLILFLVLAHEKRWKEFFLAIFAISGTAFSVAILKRLFSIPRPLDPLIDVTGYSFPSGHAAAGFVLLSLLAYLGGTYIKHNSLRLLFITLCGILILFIGWGRVLINVHTSADVFAGYAIAAAWISISILLFHQHKLPS